MAGDVPGHEPRCSSLHYHIISSVSSCLSSCYKATSLTRQPGAGSEARCVHIAKYLDGNLHESLSIRFFLGPVGSVVAEVVEVVG